MLLDKHHVLVLTDPDVNLKRMHQLYIVRLVHRPRCRGFEPHRRHCVVSLSKNINPSVVLVQPRKTRPYITERLLMGRKESNQTNKSDSFIEDMVEVKYSQHYLKLVDAASLNSFSTS